MNRRSSSLAIVVGLLAGMAAFAAVLVAPDRLQWAVSINTLGPDGGGVHHIIVPVGYWVVIAAYACLARSTFGQPASTVLLRAIALGVVLHLMLALAAFAPELAERSHFSTTVYWMYSRLFCAGAIAAATAWTVSRFSRRSRQTPVHMDLVTVPLMLGTVALFAATLRYDVLSAVAGLAAGGAVGLWVTSTSKRGGPLAVLPRRARALLTDERAFLLMVFLLALALRLLFLHRVMTNPAQPEFIDTGIDGRTYDRLAWSLAQGHGIPEAFRVQFPLILLGYVRWLGAIYLVVGHSYFAVCAVQSVLGALACLLIYGVARPLFGIGVARLTALLAALSYQLIFAAAAIGHQAVDVFLTTLTVWLLIKYIRSERPGWAAALGIGILGGCAITVRETSAFFWAFVLLWIPFALKGRLGRARSLTYAAAIMLGTMLVLAPVLAPLVATAEHRTSLREHLDRLFYDQRVSTRNELVAPFADPAAALNQLRGQPAYVVSTMASSFVHNFAVQFLTQPYGGFDVVFLATDKPYYFALWFYVYVLGGAGVLVAARRAILEHDPQSAALVLVLGVLAARTLPHLLPRVALSPSRAARAVPDSDGGGRRGQPVRVRNA